METLLGTDTQLQVIRESFGRLVYTHKTHEKDRERLSRFAALTKWTNIGLNSLTFGGVVTTIGTEDSGWLIASLILSTLSAGFAIFQMSFDPLKQAAEHRTAAKRLLGIRNQYVHLMSDMLDGSMTANQVRVRRDELEEQTSQAYAAAPDTSSWAYGKAQTALQVREDMTFSDSELNSFLPEALASSAAHVEAQERRS